MSDKEKLNNIMLFVAYNTIYSGYGYDYREALRMLYVGYKLEEVEEWYRSRIKGE